MARGDHRECEQSGLVELETSLNVSPYIQAEGFFASCVMFLLLVVSSNTEKTFRLVTITRRLWITNKAVGFGSSTQSRALKMPRG
jgi:hypothetical protein